MKTTTLTHAAFLSSRRMDSMGIVVDLLDAEGRSLAQESVRQTGDSELRNLLHMAQKLGKRYLVAAGRFNNKGISATLCDDEQTLIAAFQVVNARMDEIGSRVTAWLIKPDSCGAVLSTHAGQRAKNGNKS